MNLFAYTEPSGSYPGYVSINRAENGDVIVTVRASPIYPQIQGYPSGCVESVCGDQVSLTIPANSPDAAIITALRGVDYAGVIELERWGIEWREGDVHACKQMPDGYWTPWHIADAAIRAQSALPAPAEDGLREALAHSERVDYETQILAAEMDAVRLRRFLASLGYVERLTPMCCIQGGTGIAGCSCDKPQHEPAFYNVGPDAARTALTGTKGDG